MFCLLRLPAQFDVNEALDDNYCQMKNDVIEISLVQLWRGVRAVVHSALLHICLLLGSLFLFIAQ